MLYDPYSYLHQCVPLFLCKKIEDRCNNMKEDNDPNLSGVCEDGKDDTSNNAEGLRAADIKQASRKTSLFIDLVGGERHVEWCWYSNDFKWYTY